VSAELLNSTRHAEVRLALRRLERQVLHSCVCVCVCECVYVCVYLSFCVLVIWGLC